MFGRNYTIEELMLDDSFLNYCLEKKDADRAFWEREMEFDAAQRAIILEARFTICLLHGKLDPEEVNRQVDTVKEMVEKHQHLQFGGKGFSVSQNKSNDEFRRKRNLRKNRNLLLYSSLIATAIVFTLYFFANPLSKKQDHAFQKTMLYKTGMGQRLTVDLPDGSVAILNSNSRMIIGRDFNEASRTVILNGQAYFRVAKNKKREFVVKSGDFSATALGTSFYFHGNNEDAEYKVDLLEGKLKLESIKNNQISQSILNAGEEGSWQKNTCAFSKSSANQALHKQWLTGKLSFRNMAAGDVFNFLSKWYGVEILAAHPRLSTVRLTGDYDKQSMDEVLRIICFSLSTSYSYKDNKVIIE
jgi:transmembrane sensor